MLTDADSGSLKNLSNQTDKERYDGAVKMMEEIRARLREAKANREVPEAAINNSKDKG
jgi:hypothetical protein